MYTLHPAECTPIDTLRKQAGAHGPLHQLPPGLMQLSLKYCCFRSRSCLPGNLDNQMTEDDVHRYALIEVLVVL